MRRYNKELQLNQSRRPLSFMFIMIALVLGVLSVSVFGASVAHAEFRVPRLTGPVVDQAQMLSPTTRRTLEQALRDLRTQGGSQISVLTVSSLEGLTVEQASIRVAEQWKLGGEKEDNGVLLLVAAQERRMRIEVGQGLEGVLTDVESKRIIEDSILPLFRVGDVNSGILVGVYQITAKTDPTFDMAARLEGGGRDLQKATQRAKGQSAAKGWLMLLFIAIFILSNLTGGGRRRMRRAVYYGGLGGLGGYGMGRSRGGGFGGGRGGGWGGGGGGFSGGGASGGW